MHAIGDPLAHWGADAIRDAFEALRDDFREITRRAPGRFERREWRAVQQDSVERLGVYRRDIDVTLKQLAWTLGAGLHDRALWRRLKERYSALVAQRPERELAETFFNSITRRAFATVGVDPAVEFVDSDFDAPPGAGGPVFETFAHDGDTLGLARAVLRRFAFQADYATPEEDARSVAHEIERALERGRDGARLAAVEVIPRVFFRNQGAYVVGRLRLDGGALRPFLLALLHRPEGIVVDAALLDEDAAALVFSYTRSYFQVDVDRPYAVVQFLRTLMPGKRVHELYTALGFNKHGKTELYRDLLRHLRSTDEPFQPAPGQKGLVMVVFTLPSYDVVFKVIRDQFAPPKTTTRQRVMDKYQLVFRHDRAGRLVDAQEFEHLLFERRRFAPELLDELLGSAAGSVAADGEAVAIRHLYTERRVRPLDGFLREADPEAARRAVLDYGQALRDLAATNIFPGDILLKNWGVTRQGRVVFYDYDELSLLADCRFRDLPEPQGVEEEAQAEAWFYVDENDVFPAEFLTFIGLPKPLRETFVEAHGDLLRPEFWRGMQARLRAGEVVEIFPYPASRRLPHRRAT